MPPARISLGQARRIALAAQGFDRPRPSATVDRSHIRRVIRQLGLLQLDYVNVLVPAHLLVLFSRLGGFDTSRFHRLVYHGRDFTEQWAHEASIVPAELWPALEYRREEHRTNPGSTWPLHRKYFNYIKQSIVIARQTAPLTADDLPPLAAPRRRPGDWHRSMPRRALEYHFACGQLAVANRLANFQRVYDLVERQIDARHRQEKLGREDAQRELLARAARACGVATLHDLADYYRLPVRDAAPRVAELLESGEVAEVRVDGWTAPAYLAKGARAPSRVTARTLLSPFDPLVWFRPRLLRLFDFHYRIEIYVPAARRRWGYYVLPFLLDERIVARVDLKADRKKGVLLVLAAHAEDNIDEGRTATQLAEELRELADWLGLERIRVTRRGAFGRQLGQAVRAG